MLNDASGLSFVDFATSFPNDNDGDDGEDDADDVVGDDDNDNDT